MNFEEFEKSSFIKSFFVLSFFFIPLVFFTNLTRNPYFFQITFLNILLISFVFFVFYPGFKNKTIILPSGGSVKPFVLMLLVFFLTSVLSYLRHEDFFKPSMISEFRRIWIFTIFNCFLPFLIAHYLKDGQEDKGLNYSLSFIILWGAAWFLFPYFKSDNIFFDFYGFLVWSAGLVYLLFKTKKTNIEIVLNIAMLGAFYASVYGILQYFGFEIIWPKVLNPYGRRAVSSFGNPNFISSYVLMLIPFAIFYFVRAKEAYGKIIYFIFLVSYFGMIFASLTRSSLIGLFVSVIFLSVFKDYRDFIGINFKHFKKILLTVFLILLLWPDQNLKPLSFGVANRIYEGFANSINRFSLNVEKKDVYPSFHQRLLIWSSGVQMFRENPVIGKGWGAFELFYPFYQGWLMRVYPAARDLRTHANNAHNEIIEILSQTGILGLGSALFFLFSLFYPFFKKIKEFPLEKRIFLLTAFSSVIGMIADNMLNVSIHFAVPATLFFFLLGVLSKNLGRPAETLEIKKYGKFFSVLIFIISFILTAFWISQFLREIYYFKGFKEMRQNDFYNAIKDLEKAYSFNKREVNNNYELANAYARTEELDKAIFMYEESLKTNAGYDEIYFNLGVVQKKKGLWDSAFKNFKTSVWINPLNEKGYYALAEIGLNNNKNIKEIIEILEDGIKIHKYNSYIYNLLGYSYETLKDYEKSAYYYKKAAENDPLNDNYFLNYKRTSRDIKSKTEEFINIYRDVNLKNLFNPEELYKKLKNMETEFQDNPKFDFLMARYYFEKGDYQKSIDLLNSIKERDPSFYSAVYSLGVNYEKMGKYEEAIEMYEYYLSLNPARNDLRERINKLKIMK